MAVDKNLFMYDLAIVSIMKNEGHYVKEWLDYHLAAGVDHFYIYDHESTDNFTEVLQPYIESGIVTYIFCPDARKQVDVFNEAVQKYRFFCRYMSFVDADEFIFPQSNKSIVEVMDELLKNKPIMGGVVLNWMMYGSSNFDKADYSRGVLERFNHRAKDLVETIKTIANPRRIDYMFTPHYMVYFEGFFQLDELSMQAFPDSKYKISDKIIMNHYYCKSREEQQIKMDRQSAAYGKNPEDRVNKIFDHSKNNDVFDESILKYRKARQKIFNNKFPKLDNQKIYSALLQNLSPTFEKNTSEGTFLNNMENFLICRKLAEYLRENIMDEETGKFLEKAAIKAIYKTLFTNITLADIKLLLSELPEILLTDSPESKKLVGACAKMLEQIKRSVSDAITDQRKMSLWRDFTQYDYLMRMLQTFDARTE